MRVMFLTRGYPSKGAPTLGIFEYDMAKAVVKTGVSVVYVALDLRSIRRWRRFGITLRNQDGMTVVAVNLPLGRIYNPLRTKLAEWGLWRAYAKIAKAGLQVDLIHAHFTGAAYLAARLKERTGLPLMITEHSSKLNGPMGAHLLGKLRYAYGKADLVTAVSKALALRMEQLFEVHPTVVPNVVDFGIFRWENRDKGPPFLFVSTGNLIPGKAMDRLVEAVMGVRNRRAEPIGLRIFGQGPEEGNLQRKITQLGLQEVVTLEGLVSRDALQEAYQVAHAFVLASQSETFGVAYVEAMGAGLPVIATRCGGPEDFVTAENGLLVPPGDTKALEDAMVHMMERLAHYDGARISRDVRARFSREAVGGLLLGHYRETMERARRKNEEGAVHNE